MAKPPALRWVTYSDGDGAWAYCGRVPIGLVFLRREDGRRIGWRIKIEGINPPSSISRLGGGLGVARSLKHGQQIIERTWRRWCIAAGIGDG